VKKKKEEEKKEEEKKEEEEDEEEDEEEAPNQRAGFWVFALACGTQGKRRSDGWRAGRR